MKRNPLQGMLPLDVQRQLGEALDQGKYTMVMLVDNDNIRRLSAGQTVALQLHDPLDGLIVLMNADAVKAAYDEHDSGRNGGAP